MNTFKIYRNIHIVKVKRAIKEIYIITLKLQYFLSARENFNSFRTFDSLDVV